MEDTRDRDMSVPRENIAVVRTTIFEMYKKKEHVTLDTLLKKLQDRIATRITAWKWGRTTLYRLLTTKMNFNYGMKKTDMRL